MNETRIRWRWVAPTIVVVELMMITAAVAWVTLYSYAVRPGEPEAHYEAYAQWASPIVSIVAGVPVFYALGAWFRRRLGGDAVRTVVTVVTIYTSIDIVLLAVSPETGRYHAAMTLASGTAKLAAAWLGARLPARALARAS